MIGFEVNHINELLTNNLTKQGYSGILNVVVYYIRYNKWLVTMVSPNKRKEDKWENEDYSEFVQQFFEWMLANKKLEHVSKVPSNYKSYYFLQMLMSFASDKFSEYQKSLGVSFQSIEKISKEVLKENYFSISKEFRKYWFTTRIFKTEIDFPDLSNAILSLSRIAITEKIKHYKPLVRNAIQSIFEVYEKPIIEENLIKAVYSLFDQSLFNKVIANETSTEPIYLEKQGNDFSNLINTFINNYSQQDCELLLLGLFNDNPPSMEKLSTAFNIPKSTAHHKISFFKIQIKQAYTPITEDDGINYLKNIKESLDKRANL